MGKGNVVFLRRYGEDPRETPELAPLDEVHVGSKEDAESTGFYRCLGFHGRGCSATFVEGGGMHVFRRGKDVFGDHFLEHIITCSSCAKRLREQGYTVRDSVRYTELLEDQRRRKKEIAREEEKRANLRRTREFQKLVHAASQTKGNGKERAQETRRQKRGDVQRRRAEALAQLG